MEESVPPTIGPSVPVKVHLGITITFTVLYSLLFLLIVWQLMLILYYKHRRLSYQTLFLFTCLLWAALRTTLFSFYFQNCGLSNLLPTFGHWLLFAFPVYLQYQMLSILVFYFVMVVAKVLFPTKIKQIKLKASVVLIISNLVFLVANLTSSVLYCRYPHAEYQQTITIIRVCLDYSIFLCAALALCYCIYKLTRVNSAKMFLEGQGVSFCQAMTVCAVIALLYITRALYNILAVSPIKMPTFNYGWINVSDQGESGYHGGIKHTTENYAFISFGIVLFVWELLPTFTTVWFFRVRRPDGRITSSSVKSDSFHTKSYFFDNPNRYDSDDDLSIAYTPPRALGASLMDVPSSFGGNSPQARRIINEHASLRRTTDVQSYGSVPPFENQSTPRSFSSPHIRGTTPPLLFPKGSNSNPYTTVSQGMST